MSAPTASAPHAFEALLQLAHERAAALPPEHIPVALCQLGAVQGLLAARLAATASGRRTDSSPREDRLLNIAEAAAKLAVKTGWLYRNADLLPFTVRPTPRRLRFSLIGIERYIAQRRGR